MTSYEGVKSIHVAAPSTLRDAGVALCQHALFDLMSSGTFSSSQM